MRARLTLREDAYYATVPDGVHILTNQGETSLSGSSVHEWIERLVPLLDGRYSLDDITAALSPQRRELVSSLLTALVQRGVVRQLGQDQPHGLTEAEVTDHAPELGFLSYFRDSAAHAFECYRNLRVTVLGSGAPAAAVRRACLRSGVRAVDPATPLPAADLETRVRSADVVIQVAGDPRDGAADLVASACAQAGVPLAQAVFADGHAWLQPACRVGSDGHGWPAGRRRLLALTGAQPGPGPVTEPAVTLVAAQLVHDVFRYLTELRAPDRRPRLTRVCLDTLGTDQHDYLVHPLDVAAAGEDDEQFLERLAQLSATAPLTEEEFSRRAVTLMDSRLGIFGEISEGDLAQLPVHVTQTVVSDPVGLLGSGAPRPMVSGAGLDFETARYQAALQALACYGSLMADSRLLLGDGSLARAAALADGAVRLVAATRAFPALREPALPYRIPDGVAAGYSWDAAVTAGLLAHCRRLTIAAARGSSVPFPRIDLGTGPADEVLDYCAAMLGALGEPVEVYDVTGPWGVPTFACSLSGRTVAYGSALSAPVALRDCLLQALLGWQARANNQPGYAPAPVPDLPRACRGQHPP
ncbi:MAG: YcaO-like family protein, partial [Pseudonocardiaceae bacterium]